MTLPVRALLGNMTPEYGATVTYFPVDDETINYLRFSGRSEEVCQRVEAYSKENMLWRTGREEATFTDVLELDLSAVEPSLAGPKRPHDRVSLANMKPEFANALTRPVKQHGFELSEEKLSATGTYKSNGSEAKLGHGAVVIAAITSCTNTSNPSVMIGAGLVAKKAVEKGLDVHPWVKTSLAPGSKVVTEYLDKSGLSEYLDKLKFQTVGYGCTTCIGNSGPLPEEVVDAVEEGDLVVASVLSGNRNFEGRINPHTRANYLASPPLVVAYALAGRIDLDLINDPIGEGKDGPVYLKDIWPTNDEINEAIHNFLDPEMFRRQYGNVWDSNEMWNQIESGDDPLYAWDKMSTYIQHPPFFSEMTRELEPVKDFRGMRALAVLGDTVTTDHISPAGAIPRTSPAAEYLRSHGVEAREFNSFGSRRGNDRVMVRGTFGNIRLKNYLAPGTEGGVTRFQPDGEEMTIFEAAMKYRDQRTPLVIFAGKEYGTGSSRDWAAKGTFMLGVSAVIAESYERIHRSNLIGMGVLPLQFKEGESYSGHGIDGTESYEILGLDENLRPGQEVEMIVEKDGQKRTINLIVRLDSRVEVHYWRNGGILHTVLRQMLENC
jgi:aconitate hydratase